MAEDRRIATTRLSILQITIIGIFTILAVGFWVLQIVQHAKFEEMADNNHQRTLALRAPRGIVYDRDLKLLVENRRSYSISIVREHSTDLNRPTTLRAAVPGMDEGPARKIGDRPRREPAYRPITVVQGAS